MAEAMQNAGRGRLRKTASNLVLGKGTTGNFSVIMANDLCEAEDEELGTENNGDEEEYEEYLPKAKVYTYRERHGCCKGEEKINSKRVLYSRQRRTTPNPLAAAAVLQSNCFESASRARLRNPEPRLAWFE